VLTSVLGSEAQLINGASTEAAGVITESTFAMLSGITIAFFYSWRVALVALACSPFMMAGGALEAKSYTGNDKRNEEVFKNANLLAGDAIINYRTVASFAHDERIVQRYNEYLDGPTKSGKRFG